MVYDARTASPDPAFDDDPLPAAPETSEPEVAPFDFAWSGDDDDEPDLDYVDDDDDAVDLDDDEDDDDFLSELDDEEDDDDFDPGDQALDDEFE